jgi:hypothetical protein
MMLTEIVFEMRRKPDADLLLEWVYRRADKAASDHEALDDIVLAIRAYDEAKEI